MNENEYISSLKARDIRPTALRVLILRTMAGFDRAFSLADLEEELDTVDKSTLFRTLTLFLAHHLVHGIDDGTGSLKYALCSSDCDCEIDDLHTHFYCTHCRRTFCLRGVAVPQVGLPDGFRPKRSISLSRGSAPTVRGGTDRMDRGGLSERRNPVRPGRKRSIKGPGISGGSFPAADVSRWRASCGSAPGRNSKCRIRGGIARRVSADSDDKRT